MRAHLIMPAGIVLSGIETVDAAINKARKYGKKCRCVYTFETDMKLDEFWYPGPTIERAIIANAVMMENEE